eukprot:jgi/Psemu1/44408/gm1.44408_g
MEFSSSAKEESTTTVCHTPSQYGLILTENGPIVPSASVAAAHTNKASSNETFNSVLNSQVVHNLFVPPMDRNVMESQLFPSEDNSNNDDMVIHEEICLPIQNDNGMDAAEPTASQPNINEKEQLIRFHLSFSPTNRLMNLMTKHKLPLNTFKSIFEWANECQTIHGVDFSSTYPHHREAIFSEIKSNLGISETKFEPHIINWLPCNLPTQIFVRSFPDALHSLLTNKELMQETNLSFPNVETPLSPENNPPLTNETYITELHHGSWDRNPPTTSPRATTKQNRSSGACSSKGGALIATATSTPSSPVPSQNQGQREEDTTTKPAIDERHNVGGYFLLQQICNENDEILVLIIFYMDGISLDAHGRLSLTPLNMTLGIFNTEARK